MKNPAVEAHNATELLNHLKNKEDYIIIKGEYSKEVNKLIKTHLTETETLGFELGSCGTLSVLAYILDTFRDFIKNEPDIDVATKSIEKKLKLYKVHFASNEEVVLKLKQLDY